MSHSSSLRNFTLLCSDPLSLTLVSSGFLWSSLTLVSSGFLWSMQSPAVCEERSARSASPSLLTATVGQRVLSRLDEGSGCTSPEKVVALWTEEGLRNSRDILQVSAHRDQVRIRSFRPGLVSVCSGGTLKGQQRS